MATPETTPELDVQTAEDWQEEINWEKRYKDLQAEFTRVKQSKNQPQYQDEVEQQRQEFEEEAKKRGFVKSEDLQKFQQSLEQKERFNALLEEKPELKQFSEAIRTIAEKENLAYEDVVEKYWFSSIDKLSKAKDRSPVWEKSSSSAKTVWDLWDDEWTQWKNANIQSRNWFKKARSI